MILFPHTAPNPEKQISHSDLSDVKYYDAKPTFDIDLDTQLHNSVPVVNHHSKHTLLSFTIIYIFIQTVDVISPHTSNTPSAAHPGSSEYNPFILSDYLPEKSTGESKTIGAEFFSAIDIMQLTASQRQALIASLNASADQSTPQASASAIVQASTALPPLSTREEQEDISEMATNLLEVISRLQLSSKDRQALAASLLIPDQVTPASLTRVETASSPPPYTG